MTDAGMPDQHRAGNDLLHLRNQARRPARPRAYASLVSGSPAASV